MSSSTTVRTARRRTLRIAAAALVAAAGLGLTACSGSDAAGTKPASHAADTGKAATEVDTKAGAADQQSGTADKQSGATNTQSGSAHAGTAKTGTPVRTETLADGSKAKIYRLGEQHYLAKIVNDGAVLAELETKGHDAGLDANDMFVVLTLGGEVHSWMGGGHQGPGTFKLAGGWTAKVTKAGDLRYRAQILGRDGAVYGTMQANEHDAGLDANGVYIVLSAGGVISAHE
ncbi:hypothetical protein C3486_04880 [Streptomyces sp. Ru73]|uniref:hypothetical protein n=1 Tax=Streptomyces sp. Ru73 TaxID=2080748 RepID=UPI000CDE5439|nr:hypothetical protein [Streptomyces sp. Ru73]POX42350.1 hypothetical protein C3486_04880 [Streptomyces sp. Ru73]